MKKTVLILSLFSIAVLQCFTCDASSQNFETQVESLFSNLDSIKSSIEQKKIRKGLIKNLKKEVQKKIARLEALLAKYANELQHKKDDSETKHLIKKIEKIKEKIKKLKEYL